MMNGVNGHRVPEFSTFFIISFQPIPNPNPNITFLVELEKIYKNTIYLMLGGCGHP